MRKIGSLSTRANLFEVYLDNNSKTNPYSIYRKWYDKGWHRKLIVRYGNLSSCTAWIHQYVMDHDEEKSPTA